MIRLRRAPVAGAAGTAAQQPGRVEQMKNSCPQHVGGSSDGPGEDPDRLMSWMRHLL